ncbi:hydroxyacid oxidase 1-like [Coccinella septempunctata]|uniref:hydroxyacid oxidase 1-like n=1 Tax=Coccinella septempunctata TaxID=41139 RepID=UPI001D089A9E|nr:hydroxyacid oxidase 1-like [Coccinella septempunctata]XP_044750646.1 hydroxyacid oxidase 1-like [Coccinella septempunctata]
MEPLVCVDDYEKYAFSFLPRKNLDFYRSGAGAEITLHDNKKAFQRYRIRPRILRDVSRRDLSTTVLGQKISMPIGIAPTSLQKMAHPDGEIASAKAAEQLGTIFILSTASNSTIEEVSEAAPNCVKWFQLYVFKDRNVTRNLIERAERAGFEALVLTVDLPVIGIRLADKRNKFMLPENIEYANFKEIAHELKNKNSKVDLPAYLNSLSDASLQWQDIEWLKKITKLPIILKGIMTPEDALLAVKVNVDGILVSNHGGRQLDGTCATIDVLREIAEAVESKTEIYLDGGVRDGTDVFKALALGAKMVFVGRPVLWGLAYDGEKGVKDVMEILKREFDTTLALSGCSTINDIRSNMVVHESQLSKI